MLSILWLSGFNSSGLANEEKFLEKLLAAPVGMLATYCNNIMAHTHTHTHMPIA